MVRVTERLWLTADGKRLVPEGDPKAATLFAAAGDEIPDRDAERFGLKDGGLGRRKQKLPADDKEAPADDKEAPAGENKSGAKGGLKINKQTGKKKG